MESLTSQQTDNNKRIESLEQMRPLTGRQRFLIKSGTVVNNIYSTLKRAVITTAVSGAVAVSGGSYMQKETRKYFDYNPEATALSLQELENKKAIKLEKEKLNTQERIKQQSNSEEEKKGILDWAKDTYKNIRNKTLNPIEIIKDSDAFTDIATKYYKLLDLLDDSALVLPAATIFLTLAYVMQKLIWNRMRKLTMRDIVYNEENIIRDKHSRKTVDKLNQVIVAVNDILTKQNHNDGAENINLSLEDINKLKLLLENNRDLIDPGNLK